MPPLYVFHRKEQKIFKEKILGEALLFFLYRKNPFSRFLLFLVGYFSFFSRLYGLYQKGFWTKRKILPFVKAFSIDMQEYEKNIKDFTSFNDFFIRSLKPSSRKIDDKKNSVVLPADGRHLVFPDISRIENFFIKGQKFSLNSFLQDEHLSKEYQKAGMLISRLNPSDYHHFHFPLSCIPEKSFLISGTYYSVNPLALNLKKSIFWENKRMLTVLHSETFGKVLMVEVGATNVGSITQTFASKTFYEKGSEKGYFSFGGSTVVLIFPDKSIQFDPDLLDNSQKGMETYDQMGAHLGRIF